MLESQSLRKLLFHSPPSKKKRFTKSARGHKQQRMENKTTRMSSRQGTERKILVKSKSRPTFLADKTSRMQPFRNKNIKRGLRNPPSVVTPFLKCQNTRQRYFDRRFITENVHRLQEKTLFEHKWRQKNKQISNRLNSYQNNWKYQDIKFTKKVRNTKKALLKRIDELTNHKGVYLIKKARFEEKHYNPLIVQEYQKMKPPKLLEIPIEKRMPFFENYIRRNCGKRPNTTQNKPREILTKIGGCFFLNLK